MVLKIDGATKNETNEVIVKFKTNGTNDEYEKKIILEKVFNEKEPEPMFDVQVIETEQNTTNSESKTEPESTSS
jgi:hypothetical protein